MRPSVFGATSPQTSPARPSMPTPTCRPPDPGSVQSNLPSPAEVRRRRPRGVLAKDVIYGCCAKVLVPVHRRLSAGTDYVERAGAVAA
jgi:hypothetical protein